jgi:hypothetical protein
MASIIALAMGTISKTGALFEPFEISSHTPPIAVRPDDFDLQEACRLIGLKIE